MSSKKSARAINQTERRERLLIDLAVLLLALLIIGGHYLLRQYEPFDELIYDEIGFAHVGSRLLSEGVYQGNFSGEIWWDDPGNCGASNPRVGVFLLGFMHNLVANHLTDGREEETYIAAMRFLMALLSVGCVFVFYRFAGHVLPRRWALLAAVLLLINPVFRWVHVSVITDLPMFLFALWAMVYAVRIPLAATVEKQRTKYWLLTGLFIGLAISSKLYALSLPAVLAYLAVWQIAVIGWRRVGPPLAGIAVAVLVFFATNPLLWWDPGYGLHRLTVGHMTSLTGNLVGEFYEGVSALVRHTLTWFAWERYGRGGSIGSLGQWMMCLPVAVLIGASLLRERGAQTLLLWTFFLGNLALTAYVALGFGQPLYTPKLALLPMAGAIVLGVKGISEIVRSIGEARNR